MDFSKFVTWIPTCDGFTRTQVVEQNDLQLCGRKRSQPRLPGTAVPTVEAGLREPKITRKCARNNEIIPGR